MNLNVLNTKKSSLFYRLEQKEVQTIARLIEQNGLLQRANIASNEAITNSKGDSSYADLDQMFAFLTEIQENKMEDFIGDISQQFDDLIQRTETEMNDLNQQVSEMPIRNESSPSPLPPPNGSPIMSDNISSSPLQSPVPAQTREVDSLISVTDAERSPLYTSLQSAERSYSFEFQEEDGNFSLQNSVNNNNSNNNKKTLMNGSIDNENTTEQRRNQWVESKIEEMQRESVPENKLLKQQISIQSQNEKLAVELRTYDLVEFAEKLF